MAGTVFAIEAAVSATPATPAAPATFRSSVSLRGWQGDMTSLAGATGVAGTTAHAVYGTTHGTRVSFGTCKQLVPAPRVIFRDRMGFDAWRDPV